MPARLRSAVLLTLLVVFFFNVCVFGLVLSAQLHLHQQTQRIKIKTKKHEEVIELRIERKLVETSNSQFQWKESSEFCWNGEMYDVEESFLEGDHWVFLVEHDSKEDNIRKQIEAEEEEEDETKKRAAHSKKNSKSGPDYFEPYQFAMIINHPLLHPDTGSDEALLMAHNILPDPPPWAT